MTGLGGDMRHADDMPEQAELWPPTLKGIKQKKATINNVSGRISREGIYINKTKKQA